MVARTEPDIQLFNGRTFNIGPFSITPFPVPHPGQEPWTNYGFRIECGRRRIAYVTDLGSVPEDVFEAISDVDALFIESNHDPAMELESDRDAGTIDWVLSPHGHLSNDQCADALARMLHRPPETVILGHLSEDCNCPDLALKAARRALPDSTRVLTARQDEAMEAVTVA